MLYKIRTMGEKGIQVIVSGCMPEVQLEDILHANPEAHILGINAVSHLGKLLFSIEQRKKRLDYLGENVWNCVFPSPWVFLMSLVSAQTRIFIFARSLRAAILPALIVL
nr:hypothetical protein [Methanosarcina horonobensis]